MSPATSYMPIVIVRYRPDVRSDAITTSIAALSSVYNKLTNVQQTTLTFVDTQTWLASPEAMEMTKRLMLEVISVGQRCGVPLKNGLVDVLIARILSLPGIFSSMYVDAKENRNLEIDVILGFPMKKAKEFGMDVPTLATLYALLKAVDGRLGK
jgi:ketopantoate reductase